MASRLFARGSQYGNESLYECTVGQWDFTPTKQQADMNVSALRLYMIARLDELDDRLWWQPETSEIFYEDIEPGKNLPDECDFPAWFDEQVSDFLAHYDYIGLGDDGDGR